eukprot:308579_1
MTDTISFLMAVIVTFTISLWYFRPSQTDIASLGMDEIQTINDRMTTMEQFDKIMDKIDKMENHHLQSMIHVFNTMEQLEKMYQQMFIDKMETYYCFAIDTRYFFTTIRFNTPHFIT